MRCDVDDDEEVEKTKWKKVFWLSHIGNFISFLSVIFDLFVSSFRSSPF